MELSLKGKNALVCGSSQGIGKAIAIKFAEMGASVILLARTEELLKQTLNELHTNESQNHSYIVANLDKPELCSVNILKTLDKYKTIHILVNNTGGPKFGRLESAEKSELKTAFVRHVIASHLITTLLLPSMKSARFGRIINIISVGLKQPIDNLGVSNTIRGAMGSWAKTLSKELGPYGITVNNILPGQTLTTRLIELIKNIAESSNRTYQEVEAEMIEKIPLKRLGTPEEIANVVAFLASDLASFVNGVSLPVDGGFLSCI